MQNAVRGFGGLTGDANSTSRKSDSALSANEAKAGSSKDFDYKPDFIALATPVLLNPQLSLLLI